MPATNLIIALVFAALFGSALIWFLLYHVHRYIHQRCLELDHWFHILMPSRCRCCEHTGRCGKEGKSMSRSSRRKSRSRGRSRHEMRGESGGRQRMSEAETEWDRIGNQERQIQRPRRALPALPAVQHPRATEQYNPWQGWQGQMPGVQQYAPPAMYPQVYPQMRQQPYIQPQMSPYAMPTPLSQQQAVPIPSSVSTTRPYHKVSRKAHTERSEQRSSSKPKQVPQESGRVRRTDYIHIVDEYPPIVAEAIEKAAPPSASVSSSSGSSISTETVEEVPRVSIPQGTPRTADLSSFKFPQNPHLTSRAWNAPTPYLQ